jgi:hypothetical protein
MLEKLKQSFKQGAVYPLPQQKPSDRSSPAEPQAIRYNVFLSVPHQDAEACYWANHIDVHLRAAGLTVFWNQYESLLIDWQSALFNCVTFMPILSSNSFVKPLELDDFNQCLLECEVASVLYDKNIIKYYTPVLVGVRKVLSYLQIPNEDGVLCDVPRYDDIVQEFAKWPQHAENCPLQSLWETVCSLLSDWAVQLPDDVEINGLEEIINGLYSRDVSAIFGDADACERALQAVVESTRNAQICNDEGFDIIVMVEADFLQRIEGSKSTTESDGMPKLLDNFMRQLHESNFIAHMMVIDTGTLDTTDSEIVNISHVDVLTPDQMRVQFLQPEFAKTKVIIRILCASPAWDDTFLSFKRSVLSKLQIQPLVFEAVTNDLTYDSNATRTILDIRKQSYAITSMALKQALNEAEKRITSISSQNPREQFIRKLKIVTLSALVFALAMIVAIIAILNEPQVKVILNPMPMNFATLGSCMTVIPNCQANALCVDKVRFPQLANFTNSSYSYSCVCDESKGFIENDNLGSKCLFPLQNVTNMATESLTTCAIVSTGQLYCWGLKFSQDKAHVPELFSNISSVKSIHLGPSSACALKTDGSIWCWGVYSDRNLGNGVSSSTATPIKVQSLQQVMSLCVAKDTACAITLTGVSCWGANFMAPMELVSSTVPKAVACGTEHVCVLRNDRTVMCFGYENRHLFKTTFGDLN